MLGLAQSADLDVTPRQHDFGQIETGQVSALQTITLANFGLHDLYLTGIGLQGHGAGAFLIRASSCYPVLVPGAACVVQVSFNPSKVGAVSEMLMITSSDPDEAVIAVALQGEGQAPPKGPKLSVSPRQHDFGVLDEGESVRKTITLTNPGDQPLTLAELTFGGTSAADFILDTQTCGAVLLPAAECTVQIAFTPHSFGAKRATLTIRPSAGGPAPVDVILTAEVNRAVSTGEDTLPVAFRLDQNYPNPFNPNTQITYAIPEATFVRLAVYDLLGRERAVLVEGWVGAGIHHLSFSAATWPNGLYIYRLEAAHRTFTRKMTVLK